MSADESREYNHPLPKKMTVKYVNEYASALMTASAAVQMIKS